MGGRDSDHQYEHAPRRYRHVRAQHCHAVIRYLAATRFDDRESSTPPRVEEPLAELLAGHTDPGGRRGVAASWTLGRTVSRRVLSRTATLGP